jgi:hypothetical protein
MKNKGRYLTSKLWKTKKTNQNTFRQGSKRHKDILSLEEMGGGLFKEKLWKSENNELHT